MPDSSPAVSAKTTKSELVPNRGWVRICLLFAILYNVAGHPEADTSALSTFDYIAPKDPAMYDLRFRVVRFRISGGYYETVYTNLDSETFPIGTIKELYRLRWGIETSFRELKYTIGLSCLHGKKTDFLLQEVFARLILYNYASLIARKIPVPQEKQINFSTAILVCKQFLKGKIRSAQIFEILSKHLSPIRPGRQYKRYQNPVSAVAFQYRFS